MLPLQPALPNPSAPPNPCVGTSFPLISTNAIPSLLIFILSEDLFDHVSSSPGGSPWIPSSVRIRHELLLPAFKACHPSVGIRPFPVPGLPSAAHSRFLRCIPEPGFTQTHEQMRFRRWRYSSALTIKSCGVLSCILFLGCISRRSKEETLGPMQQRGTISECEHEVHSMKKL